MSKPNGAFRREIRLAAQNPPKFTREEIEQQCVEDYEAVVGKVVLVRMVECSHPAFGNITVVCDPPAIARVEPHHDGSASDFVRRWMDWENCDPVYDISVLEGHPAFSEVNARPSWVYGTSRWLTGGSDPAYFVLADEATQELYRDAEAVEYPIDGERSDAPYPSAPIC
ncbi:hypothetical protein G6L37_06335 [Agrobacterium rubi]|nr:hypothetical protein [Agrobacterium rubi]NTF24980.1 hypothetical protein [Agrobacterium rubi]